MTSKEKALAMYIWKDYTLDGMIGELRLERDPIIKEALQYTIGQKGGINLVLLIEELTNAIKDICLGSIEAVVIEAAVNELLLNWNDHSS